MVDGLRVAGVDHRDALARQLDEVLRVRRDADVVELVVAEGRLRAADAVARHAAPAAVEDGPAAPRARVDRLVVAGEVAVERRIEDDLRALVGGEGARQIVAVDGAPEHLLKRRLILGHLRHGGDGGVEGGHAHLDRVGDRQLGLIFEVARAAVPELRVVVERVQHRRRVAVADLLLDADRGLAPSVKPLSGSWQVAQATLPSAERRPSKKSFSPSATLSRARPVVGRRHRARQVLGAGRPDPPPWAGPAAPALGISARAALTVKSPSPTAITVRIGSPPHRVVTPF